MSFNQVVKIIITSKFNVGMNKKNTRFSTSMSTK